jgi:hypothetical protein
MEENSKIDYLSEKLLQFIAINYVEKESKEYYDKLNLDESLKRLKIQVRLRQQRTLTIQRFKIGKQPFIELLKKYCHDKKMDHQEIFELAKIDQNMQSEIINSIDYLPPIEIIFKLIIALKLRELEARNLLEECQMYFRMWEYLDVIVLFCLRNRMYEYHIINKLLKKFHVDQL